MTDEQMLAELDAYGHLTWTLGDLDWMACFDAQRFGDKIAYQVVINCESAGFIETTEKGVLPVSEAAKLIDLPDVYIQHGLEGHHEQIEHYRTKRWDARPQIGHFAFRTCVLSWARHIRQLCKQ